MKTLIITLFAIGSIFSVHAQNPELECRQKTILFDSLVKAGNFQEATAPWTLVRKSCPSSTNLIYEAGEAILQYNIEMAATADKEIAVRDLLQLYDEQLKFFPAKTSGIALKKAMALQAINGGSDEEIYRLLDNAFSAEPQSFDNPTAAYKYFELYFNKYKNGDKSISIANLLVRQDAIESRMALWADGSINAKKSARSVSKGIDVLLAGLLTCENLTPFYDSAFEARKNDTLWLSRASSRLLKSNCITAPVFLKISDASHSVQPTKQSAYNLGAAALRSGDREKAATYFSQSAELSTTQNEKASSYYMIASTVYGNSNKPKAKQYAQMAIAANPNMGKAYMFLAQLYANSGRECATSPFEQKAIYWLAADMVKKAGLADANLKKSGSDKTADDYLKKAPTSTEIKQQKMGGKQVTFKCWINESVTVPKA